MATRPYNWQSLASPAASSGSSQAGASPYSVDSFHGSYPNAPHLRPIELPETGSPMPVYANPGSSRSRTTSLPPPEVTGLGIYTYGIPSPPTSPHSTSSANSSARTSVAGSGSSSTGGTGPTVHPLLRGYSNSLSSPLAYNVLRAPSAHGLRTTEGVRINPNDLNFPATHPTYPALRVSVLLYPGNGNGSHGGRRFMWDVTLTPSRRSSAPPTTTHSAPLTLGDALASLHLSLLAPVSESELRQVGPQDLQSARAACAARHAAHPNSPSALVRADFLYGCTEFAGFVRNADGSFAVRLVPRA